MNFYRSSWLTDQGDQITVTCTAICGTKFVHWIQAFACSPIENESTPRLWHDRGAEKRWGMYDQKLYTLNDTQMMQVDWSFAESISDSASVTTLEMPVLKCGSVI